MSLPFPRSQKEVQQVMGTAIMFLRFTPGYSTLAKDITDMSSKTFNWDESTWTVNHRESFDKFKLAVSNSLTLHYPDYDLNWILRTDASTTGCGVVLYQEYVAPGGIIQEQVIAILSHKFSGPATRWPTIEQEAYAIFFGVKKLEYLLMCKSFVVETDHRNLVWMETSLVSKIIRWRIYLQAFDMSIKHIKGTDNGTADWLSRLHSVESHVVLNDVKNTVDSVVNPSSLPCSMYTPRQCFERVHGGRMGHPGLVRTMKLLTKYFPAHGMSQEAVANLVADCPHCQKIRMGMDTPMIPMHRTLSQGHLRAAIGCDTLTVTPTDDNGCKYIIVVVNLFSKFVALYPVQNHDAISLATALFQYYCTYGICEKIVTDPGSDLTSEVIRHLHRFFGIRHVFSVVERHQSNGVEGTNKTVLRHLRSIVHDERLIRQWSSPTVLPLIQYMINCEHESSESGIIPLHAQFGNLDAVYQKLPIALDPAHLHHEFVQTLADNIALVRAVARQHQASIAADRSLDLPDTQHTQFQPGDYVLKRLEHRPSKLMFQLSGPYRVVSQTKNDVQVRSLVYDNILTFHLDHLKVFIGTEAEAKSMALLDKNQYLIKEVQAYRGDPSNRSSCSFLVWFEDNDLVWLPYSLDISNTSQFEAFCSTRPELYTLLYSYAEAQKMIAAINRSPISEVKPGDTVFVDLRFYGSGWYQSLDLPSSDILRYVVPFTYVRWYHKTSHTKIVAQCLIFKEEWPVNHHFVRSYGSLMVPPEGSQLVDSDLVHRFPHILPPMTK
jgi:phospholipid-translocating ATPase